MLISCIEADARVDAQRAETKQWQELSLQLYTIVAEFAPQHRRAVMKKAKRQLTKAGLLTADGVPQ